MGHEEGCERVSEQALPDDDRDADYAGEERKTHIDPRNTHKGQEFPAILVVLSRDFHLATIEFIDVLGRS